MYFLIPANLAQTFLIRGHNYAIDDTDLAIQAHLYSIEASLLVRRRRVGRRKFNVLRFRNEIARWQRMDKVGGKDSFKCRRIMLVCQPLVLQRDERGSILFWITALCFQRRTEIGRAHV